MDETCSESDLSLSPSQIFERLQVLRQLQLLQRGKLQKQRLKYRETSETSSSITEIVSHFSNSTSYNTFRSLLQSSNDTSNDGSPRFSANEFSPKIQEQDLIDGVSVLNLSQESEFIVTTPISSRSRVSASSKTDDVEKESINNSSEKTTHSSISKYNENVTKKQISLDEMPILSNKQNFETLLLEKLNNEKNVIKSKSPKATNIHDAHSKKPFLKKGEGMARFGIKKNDLKIQNTKSLPWKTKKFRNKTILSPLKSIQSKNSNNKHNAVEILITEPQPLSIKSATLIRKSPSNNRLSETSKVSDTADNEMSKEPISSIPTDTNNCNIPTTIKSNKKVNLQKSKHPLAVNKGKTWASVLTKEQDDFLRQLKQSDYYKNFNSPAKSILSDISCDESSKFCHEKEIAEQNMFELLENKVSHESFNIENSFFNRFLRRNNLECSGESTPLVLQKCLERNPDLMHILPELRDRKENSQSDAETCCSNYTECCSDACSSISCCSCKTVEHAHNFPQKSNEFKESKEKKEIQSNKSKKVVNNDTDNKSHNNTVIENDIMKKDMAEMNAKLIATSELLKDRLRELEDEIETFRKENSNLAKLREDVDQERQKFYEEKAAFEQKFNEDKVLSEYYLADEREKLAKQKQMYERYVREIRGRLNKKDKDEVINLKKEISDLKEEIRNKDAKSTSTVARLRNQIKIMEKEKKELNDEVEKLRKQNRRIQHSNEVTRRLTNIKYLEEINKKLSNMSSKETCPKVTSDSNIKYKAYEIERQSRIKKVAPVSKGTLRPRAKSVPNLNVTSSYAKYFSQRDTISQGDHIKLNLEGLNTSNDDNIQNDTLSNDTVSLLDDDSGNEEENNLEKIYMERFRTSPKSNRSSGSNTSDQNYLEKADLNENAKGFFISKSNSSKDSKSPKRSLSPYLNHTSTGLIRSKSPVSILSNKSNGHQSPLHRYSSDYSSNYSNSNYSHNRSKSPVTVPSNQSSQNQKTATVIHNDQYREKLMVLSPEPASKTSLTKTNLNPTEIRNPDGSKELRFPNGNVKYISADKKYSKFVYYNGDVKENFYDEGRIKYFYAETKTYHTTYADGLEVLEFPDGQVEKRYKDGSSEIRLPNGSVRYYDPKNEHVREEWRFPDGAAMTVSASGEQRIVFTNGQVEVHAKDHKRREFPDGTVKLVYSDGTSETRYASGRVRIKDKHGNLIMDSASG